MAGSAVATMVWSTTARNIGSMIEKKMRKNGVRAGAGGRGSPRGGVAGGVAGGLADESAGGPAGGAGSLGVRGIGCRSEVHTSELQSLMRISFSFFFLFFIFFSFFFFFFFF